MEARAFYSAIVPEMIFADLLLEELLRQWQQFIGVE